ncbi:MAG: hypothetical protein JST93_12365 [Acidobacteria bacterium]|nr:hypothetical protein [Acidobacteriota bacterium]
MKATLFLLIAVPAAWGQTFSSPIRDVENPDKNLVSASCQFDFSTAATAENGSCQADFAVTKAVVVTSIQVACHSDVPSDRFRRTGPIWAVSNDGVGLFGGTRNIIGSFHPPVISDVVEQGAEVTGTRLLAKISSSSPSPFLRTFVTRVKQSPGTSNSRCYVQALGYVAP